MSFAVADDARAAEPARDLTRLMRPQIEAYLHETGPFCAKLAIDGGNGRLLYYRPERSPPAAELAKYDALVQAGVLRSYKSTERPDWVWYERTGVDEYVHPAAVCFGKRQFAGIEAFTPARRVDCWRLREVKYRYRVAGVPSWARHPAITANFPELPRFEGEVLDGELPMMFLEGQWRLHRFDLVHALYFCDK